MFPILTTVPTTGIVNNCTPTDSMSLLPKSRLQAPYHKPWQPKKRGGGEVLLSRTSSEFKIHFSMDTTFSDPITFLSDTPDYQSSKGTALAYAPTVRFHLGTGSIRIHEAWMESTDGENPSSHVAYSDLILGHGTYFLESFEPANNGKGYDITVSKPPGKTWRGPVTGGPEVESLLKQHMMILGTCHLGNWLKAATAIRFSVYDVAENKSWNKNQLLQLLTSSSAKTVDASTAGISANLSGNAPKALVAEKRWLGGKRRNRVKKYEVQRYPIAPTAADFYLRHAAGM